MEGKKSFVLYTDHRDLVHALADEQAWKLLKHIFSYVNDEDPDTEDQIVKIAFESFKKDLKRDLNKRKEIREKRSEAWKMWWAKKWNDNAKRGFEAKQAKTSKNKQTEAKQAVNVNVNVNDNISPNGDRGGLSKKQELEEYVQKRNAVPSIWLAKKWLPNCLKITDAIYKSWCAKRKQFTYDEIKQWTNKYVEHLKKIKPKDQDDTYFTHRFTMLEFLKQANWLEKYFNS